MTKALLEGPDAAVLAFRLNERQLASRYDLDDLQATPTRALTNWLASLAST